MFLFLLLYLLLGLSSGCTEPAEPPSLEYSWQTIESRDEGSPSQRFPLYRAKVPNNWIRQAPSLTESIADSTLANCTFWIEDTAGKIKVSIHNFPTENINQRVPPLSQINRWKRQFDSISPASAHVAPCSHGGFSGLYITASGIMNGSPTTIIGWSMLIAPEHYQHLHAIEPQNFAYRMRQMRSDYTIKAVGPPEAIENHREELLTFGNSFELIKEIPTR